MKNIKKYLMIPGPTQVPTEVALASAMPMINHRSKDFKDVLLNITTKMKKFYKTEKGEIFVLTSSGTGGMETAIVNTLSPNDKVLVLSIGNFGERFAKICKSYGLDTETIDFEYGSAIDPKVVDERLSKDKNKEIKAVLMQHNETSTGVVNNIEAVAKVIKKHGALIIVDAVSGLLSADLRMDEWGLDVVVSGSQKAFMVPPGIAFIGISERTWDYIEKSKLPKFYYDLKQYKKFVANGETPWTPAISVCFGLNKAIDMLLEEGIENVIKRHEELRNATRAGVRALDGFKLLAKDECASRAVTSVYPKEGVDAEEFRKIVREKYGVVLAGGQGSLKGKIFRISHLGYIDQLDTIAAFAAIEMALVEMGQKIELGKSISAIQESLLNKVAISSKS